MNTEGLILHSEKKLYQGGPPMSQPIQSEAHLTTFEAISMIVGNSIGTGIIAVPYLATKNSMLDVVWM